MNLNDYPQFVASFSRPLIINIFGYGIGDEERSYKNFFQVQQTFFKRC